MDRFSIRAALVRAALIICVFSNVTCYLASQSTELDHLVYGLHRCPAEAVNIDTLGYDRYKYDTMYVRLNCQDDDYRISYDALIVNNSVVMQGRYSKVSVEYPSIRTNAEFYYGVPKNISIMTDNRAQSYDLEDGVPNGEFVCYEYGVLKTIGNYCRGGKCGKWEYFDRKKGTHYEVEYTGEYLRIDLGVDDSSFTITKNSIDTVLNKGAYYQLDSIMSVYDFVIPNSFPSFRYFQTEK